MKEITIPFLIALTAGILYSTRLPNQENVQGNAQANAKMNVVGTWGGEHVVLDVSKNGAVLEFDCAHGQIDQPLILDKKGRFAARGTFTPEHGGPVRRDEVTPSSATRYSGQVKGDVMTLKVVGGAVDVGIFTLNCGIHRGSLGKYPVNLTSSIRWQSGGESNGVRLPFLPLPIVGQSCNAYTMEVRCSTGTQTICARFGRTGSRLKKSRKHC